MSIGIARALAGCLTLVVLLASAGAFAQPQEPQRIGVQREANPQRLVRLDDKRFMIVCEGGRFLLGDIDKLPRVFRSDDALDAGGAIRQVIPLLDGHVLLAVGDDTHAMRMMLLKLDDDRQMSVVKPKVEWLDACGAAVLAVKPAVGGNVPSVREDCVAMYWDDYRIDGSEHQYKLDMPRQPMLAGVNLWKPGYWQKADEVRVLNLETGRLGNPPPGEASKVLRYNNAERIGNSPLAVVRDDLTITLIDLEANRIIATASRFGEKRQRIDFQILTVEPRHLLVATDEEGALAVRPVVNGQLGEAVYQTPGRNVIAAAFLDPQTLLTLHPKYALMVHKLPATPAAEPALAVRPPLDFSKLDADAPSQIAVRPEHRLDRWTWSDAEKQQMETLAGQGQRGRGLYVLETERWVVQTDISPRFAVEVATYLSIFEDSLRRSERLFVGYASDARAEVVILKSASEYAKLQRIRGSAGHANWTFKGDEIDWMGMLLQTADDTQTLEAFDRRTLNHETVHCMLQKVLGAHQAQSWLHEGCAVYYESWHPKRPAGEHPQYVRKHADEARALAVSLRQTNAAPTAKSVFDLRSTALTWRRGAGTDTYLNYAKAMAMFDFLMYAPASGQTLATVLERIASDRGTHVLREEAEALEPGWRQWLREQYVEGEEAGDSRQESGGGSR